ncbi:hypothetical protein EDD30_4585 [Couchioplanes caeruleus]|nr:hypothetical protein EDD30_4585 [Couchioplanes caeruleus]
MDHLYLEYQDCAVKPCRRMLAATSDRGRTWRKQPLPVDEKQRPTSVVLVHRTLVIATAEGFPRPAVLPTPEYWASTDAGVTWHRSTVSEVHDLPLGWLVRQGRDGMFAFDPATGNVAWIRENPREPRPFGRFGSILDTVPAGAGLWSVHPGRGRGVLKVSQDGGRTWDTRTLPDLKHLDGLSVYGSPSVVTVDGQTVYAMRRGRTRMQLVASVDGGRTWEDRATVELGGPLLTVLPIDDRTVIVEGLHGTYRSTDQGRTFTRVGPSLGARGHAIPGGFTIPTNNNEYSAWVSADGAEWTYVKRPEVP